ncbi:hypothetical protein [Thermorudis peleae]|uniref:hypothetical protein n=1 Tax=Thermorudis peleae TaxID=1382356 RepID=UPI00056E3A46|nr:hypothetical protein [Thermorudis peleae]
MAGKTRREAIAAYLEPLKETLACVCPQRYRHVAYHGPDPAGLSVLVVHRLEPVPLRRQDGSRLWFEVRQLFRVVETERLRGPYTVATAAYLYQISYDDGRELLAFHWHPHGQGKRTTPHVHIGPAVEQVAERVRELHIPTGYVSLEAVVRFLIDGLSVAPQRFDWSEVLARNEARHNQ